MTEPLEFLYSFKDFNPDKVRELVIGEKYIGIMNKEGNIGICATLGTKVTDDLLHSNKPDLNNLSHRIILNAYLNSYYNYEREYNNTADIFDRIDFRDKGRVIMVGYFESLYRKFSDSNIKLEVFDIHKKDSAVQDISGINDALSGADTVILTGTTIFNNTFRDIITLIRDNCNIFLLGPSNVLSEKLFIYPNIRIVFGSVFKNNDRRVLDKIASGQGTKGFLKYLRKVYIIEEKYMEEI